MPQEHPPKRLLDQTRESLRTQHYSMCTEEAIPKRWQQSNSRSASSHHPLAIEWNIVASIQNQALCALIYLYREVLK